MSPKKIPIFSVETDLESYTTFYKEYAPHENFAHVFFPNHDCYNKQHFSVNYPNIVLGIDGKIELLNAVCFDCKSEYIHLGEYSRRSWNIHNLLKIEHSVNYEDSPLEIHLLR